MPLSILGNSNQGIVLNNDGNNNQPGPTLTSAVSPGLGTMI